MSLTVQLKRRQQLLRKQAWTIVHHRVGISVLDDPEAQLAGNNSADRHGVRVGGDNTAAVGIVRWYFHVRSAPWNDDVLGARSCHYVSGCCFDSHQLLHEFRLLRCVCLDYLLCTHH